MRISIVTPSLNRVGSIAAALQSLVDQYDEDVEHLVVDGGSTDGTIELVRARFPHVRLIVQRDRNLYEAINRGLTLSTGDVIGLLNSDDRLYPKALAAVRAGFTAHPTADAICGGCALHFQGAAPEESTIQVFNAPAMKALRVGDIISGLILTNGRFFKRHVIRSLGGFDDDFPVLADREFLARFHLRGYATAVIDDILYSYGCHSGSLTFNLQISAKHLAEATAIARRRMTGTALPSHRRFYRRWHGWAAGYECIHALSQRETRRSLGLIARATRSDPLWAAFLLRHTYWHLRTRTERC